MSFVCMKIFNYTLLIALQWLEEEFMMYLIDWENNVEGRQGFSKTEKGNILLSHPTRLGLKMTCKVLYLYKCENLNICVTGKSFVELVRYLFTMEDVNSFLSQRICQDPLERFFGCQRQRGAVHDNPNIQEFLKNTQALRVVNSVARGPLRGNCRGGNEDVVDKENNNPLPKRPRNRKSSKTTI